MSGGWAPPGGLRGALTARRGADLEFRPLFGQELDHYDEYSADRLGVLLRIRVDDPVTWSGTCAGRLQGVARPERAPARRTRAR